MKRVPILLLFLLPASAASLSKVESKAGAVRSETIAIPKLSPSSQYSFLYSVSPLASLTPDSRIEIEIRQQGAVLASKTLHAGDPDYYTQFRVPHAGPGEAVIHAVHASGNYQLQVNRWPASQAVKSLPDGRWQDAVSIMLGKTVFASGDDREYIPLPGTPRSKLADFHAEADWYKFAFDSDTPKLVYFQIELMDRDQIPVNLEIYRMAGGKLEPYYEGEDPVTMPHEVQALAANEFTPRTLRQKGEYYIAVHAGYPVYKLRTRVYEPPPYRDPHLAVRAALDYILGAADLARQHSPAGRHSRSGFQRASGNIALRRMPHHAFPVARSALCASERVSGASTLAATVPYRTLL